MLKNQPLTSYDPTYKTINTEITLNFTFAIYEGGNLDLKGNMLFNILVIHINIFKICGPSKDYILLRQDVL